jgi:hypothetical protein
MVAVPPMVAAPPMVPLPVTLKLAPLCGVVRFWIKLVPVAMVTAVVCTVLSGKRMPPVDE